MKTLIICNDEKTSEIIEKTVEECKCASIVYRWFLKALDNIEEIGPDIIIINISEYPRHWKILAQFVNSGIKRTNGKIILYSANSLDENEIKKTQQLNVLGHFDSLETAELNKLKLLIKSLNKDIFTQENLEKTSEKENSIYADEEITIISVDDICKDIYTEQNDDFFELNTDKNIINRF